MASNQFPGRPPLRTGESLSRVPTRSQPKRLPGSMPQNPTSPVSPSRPRDERPRATTISDRGGAPGSEPASADVRLRNQASKLPALPQRSPTVTSTASSTTSSPSRLRSPSGPTLGAGGNPNPGVVAAGPRSVSGDTTRRHVLRRKPSTINEFAQATRGGQAQTSTLASSSMARSLDGAAPTLSRHRTPELPARPAYEPAMRSSPSLTISLPEQDVPHVAMTATADPPTTFPPEQLWPHDLPPPNPLYSAHSSSPSTRHSESPGPWSRTSTPTSMSSHSPGLTVPAKWAPRPRQMSPSQRRPPITWKGSKGGTDEDVLGRYDVQGLPSLRESLTSSSSGSTIKAGERNESAAEKESSRKERRLSPPPPSPPPRKSSMKQPRLGARQPSTQDKLTRMESSRIPNPPLGPQPLASHPTLSKIPSNSSVSRELPPPRPSRDGAPNLEDPNHSMPVIHSNLTELPFPSHRRRGSTETSASGLSGPKWVPTNPSVTGTAHKRRDSGARAEELASSPDQPPTRAGAGVLRGLSPAPSFRPAAEVKVRKRDQSPSQRTSPSRGLSRFGFFGRRTKVDPDLEASEKQKKSSKKGPAAGTGHEGYGRYAFRGRSGSTTSASGSWARSPSASTSGSGARSAPSRKGSVASRGEQKLDEFFLERLDPVVIVGGSTSVESQPLAVETAGIGGSQSSLGGRPSIDSQDSSGTEFSSLSKLDSNIFAASRDALEQFPEEFFPRSPPRAREHGVDQERAPTPGALSSWVSQTWSSKGSHRALPPITTDPAELSRSTGQALIGSASTMPSTGHSELTSEDVSEGKEGNWLRPKTGWKRAPSPRKWNPLHRPAAASESTNLPEVAVQVGRHLPTRPLAHYAMLDSASPESPQDLETMLTEVAQFVDTDDEESGPRSEQRQKFIPSVLLPDPPALPPGFQNPRPVSPKVLLRPEESLSPPSEPVKQLLPSKPSRLPQVGRIPRVVSTRVRKPPPQSFSRPFSSVRPDIALAATSTRVNAGANMTTVQPVSQDRISAEYVAPLTSPGAGSRLDQSQSPPTFGFPGYHVPSSGKEFLSFSPRKGSVVSCSGSSGVGSIAAHTAVLFPPDAGPGEDEVWREYDDLIDRFSPTPGQDARLSYGFPAPIEVTPEPTMRDESGSSHPLGLTAHLAHTKFAAETKPQTSATTTLAALTEPIRLLDPADTPVTPVSFSDIFAGYGERSSSGGMSAGGRMSVPEKTEDNREDQSGSVEVVDHPRGDKDSLDSETNLRFGALMTSRWLSFGRVLFSPAHNEINQAAGGGRQERLLVLDGLGNDDWSYYCALTYPHATVYNLSPSPRSSTMSIKKESGAFQSPSNHRQLHYSSIAHPFPFPKGFFAVVVFRFPVASSEAAYRNAISECKRVLRPGGYLETSVLDLDLMNMGNRARRAVRTLKVRMQQADSSVSLKPTSDNILRLLGRRGFENVNRCMLGVPVAGNVAGSRETSMDESSLSLSELLRDPSKENDEGITKMVARVGRWWYSRCHETGTFPDGDQSLSIWNDRALLRECEKGKTSFKLLICYAQKPLAPRRRTVSV